MAQVVLVEDDDAIRASLTRSLRASGHIVTSVARGLDAISQVVDAKPDVVLLDLGLPDLDGADVLAMLRSVSRVPVIVATARDDEQEVGRQLVRKASTGLILAGLSGGIATGALAAALANQDQQDSGTNAPPTGRDDGSGTAPGVGIAPALPGPIQGGSNGS